MTRRVIFMSASVPDPRRHARYYETADVIAIREAVRALAAVVLARGVLVFGGHPAITPMVRQVAEAVGGLRSVRLYQSAYFKGDFPSDNSAFPSIRTTDRERDLASSIATMREAMFSELRFSGAVFIGGMEGVETEYAMFVERHPKAKVLPVATTGAAAALLFGQVQNALAADVSTSLAGDTVYGAMFERLLWPARPGGSKRPGRT